MATPEQIRIDIEAEDKASKVLEDVADDAADLEKLTPELEVTADTTDADRGIKDVSDDASALSKQDTEILLKAKIDDAKAALKTLRDDLDDTGKRARDTATDLDKVGNDGGGLNTRGNAIADLTGPLGDASGAASDFAGVFDGIGDIAEDVAGKVGLNAAVMSTAIGGIGIAVAAAAAVWTIYQGNQEKAKARQKELVDGQRDLNAAIAEGNYADAGRKLQELYPSAINGRVRELGVSISEITAYITGQTDALPSLTGAFDAARTAAGELSGVQLGGQTEELLKIKKAIDDARAGNLEANGSWADQEAVVADVALALQGYATDTDRATSATARAQTQTERTKTALDRMRGSLDMQQTFLNFQHAMDAAMAAASSDAGVTADDILSIKQSILDVAEFAGLNPIEVKSLLERVDQGDLAGVKADVETYYNNNAASVRTSLKNPTADDIEALKKNIRDQFGTLNVQVTPTYQVTSGQVYQGPR